MKHRKLKSLHREKIHRTLYYIHKTCIRYIFTFQVIPYTIRLNLFSKCYSKFLIDVIRLEFGNGLRDSGMEFGRYEPHYHYLTSYPFIFLLFFDFGTEIFSIYSRLFSSKNGKWSDFRKSNAH